MVVQKKVTDEILNLAGKAKDQGATIVYDVDDLSSALDYWTSPAHFAGILELADLITTDTEGHREFLMKNCEASRVEIVPDCIDYYPDSPCPVLTKDAAPMRVMWFGSIGNIDLFQKYAEILRSIPDVEVVVMTGAESIRDYAATHSGITVVPWSRAGFIESLQSCHLTCLMHDGSEIDRAKSNNKMITSIHWGVPAAVSRTPEYERTAREARIEDALFESDRELRMVVERFRPAEMRRNYLLLIAVLVLLSNFAKTTGEFILGKAVAQHASAVASATGLTREDATIDSESLRGNAREAISLSCRILLWRRFARPWRPVVQG